MRLKDAIAEMNQLEENALVCARRPWGPEAECRVVIPDPDLGVPGEVTEAGFEYFLEVGVAREVLEALPEEAELERKVELVVYYAENDAFPELDPKD